MMMMKGGLPTSSYFKAKMMKIVSFACSIFVFDGLARSSGAETLLAVDPDKDALIQRQGAGPAAGGVVLRQGERDITTSIDPGTPYSVWRTAEPGRPGLSLAVRIDAEHRPPEAIQKSKFEFNVVRQDDRNDDAAHAGHYILRNDSSNYLGFAIKLDRKFYDAPTRWLLHFQVWQCCSLKTLPPLVLQAVPDSDPSRDAVAFALIARNDDDRADNPRSDVGQHLRFLDGAQTLRLERDRWYSMVLFLKPDPGTLDNHGQGSPGQVDLWVDGHHALHYAGAWGYTPDAAADVRDTYAVKLGIYRAAQPTRQQVYFNDIRWGTDRVSVDPDAHR